MTDNEQTEAVQQLGAAADEAVQPLASAIDEIKSMVATNEATIARLAQQHGAGIQVAEVVGVRLAALVEMLFGGIDQEAHQAYERAVQTRLAELLANTETLINRAKLTQGVQGIDLSQLKNLPPKS